MTAILTRRSIHELAGPAPSDQEFAYLLKGAAAAPDHGGLRPWRWILLRDAELAAVGDRLGADAEDRGDSAGGAPAGEESVRAPLKAVLVFSPSAESGVPEWEQLAAASNVAYGLMLLLHARGFGSVWRKGRWCRSERSRELLGIGPDEQLLGSLDIGTPGARVRPDRRRVEDVTDRMCVLRT
ncbi:nitroreductase family protein [Streptomyces cremeus]|uniref:Putative NAD(P)H nitroreductase n=1 Tax=Streptomyces cremeus TaxID=66881 RepID=A0ABV5P5U7_STRCM